MKPKTRQELLELQKIGRQCKACKLRRYPHTDWWMHWWDGLVGRYVCQRCHENASVASVEAPRRHDLLSTNTHIATPKK